MNLLELDEEIGKIARAMMTRNSQIGGDLIAHLKTQMPPESVAGVLLVSIERLIWFDTEAVIWATQSLFPADVMQEIHRLMALPVYKQLIAKGYVPGKDMSVDGNGKLLLKRKARLAA